MAHAKKPTTETGLEPHFHITETRYEVSSDGNLIGYAYEEIRGELRLQYTVVITAANLLKAARAAMQASAETHNATQWSQDMGEDGSSH